MAKCARFVHLSIDIAHWPKPYGLSQRQQGKKSMSLISIGSMCKNITHSKCRNHHHQQNLMLLTILCTCDFFMPRRCLLMSILMNIASISSLNERSRKKLKSQITTYQHQINEYTKIYNKIFGYFVILSSFWLVLPLKHRECMLFQKKMEIRNEGEPTKQKTVLWLSLLCIMWWPQKWTLYGNE